MKLKKMVQKTLLITIGIPCYNAERFIELAIKSVLCQTYDNFELIITDDGSQDKTVEIIRQFTDSRIKLVSDNINRGISFRLNQQIDMANGDIFVRMDADDLMFPTRLEHLIYYLESNPEIDVVGSSAVVINNDNQIIGIRLSSYDFSQPLSFDRSAIFIHPTVAGRTKWFRKYHYKDEFNGCEDCNLWMRSYAESKFYIIPEPLYFYREPLVFKLSTYLFRKKQGRKMSIAERKYVHDNLSLLFFILKSYLSGFAAMVLHLCKLDKQMIAKRNCEISLNDKIEYDEILSEIIYFELK